MVQARIHQGRVEVEEPLPAEWEGQLVNITPLTPDDPNPDIEAQLKALHDLGPMEYEPGEREMIEAALKEMDEISKKQMQALMDETN